jgi:hypothetical protein
MKRRNTSVNWHRAEERGAAAIPVRFRRPGADNRVQEVLGVSMNFISQVTPQVPSGAVGGGDWHPCKPRSDLDWTNDIRLWTARSSDARRKMWCGPVAVAALIGVDVAAIRDVVKWHRNGKARHSAISAMTCNALPICVATRQPSPPGSASAWIWTRPYVVVVTRHWAAVRGKCLCDTFTRGVPVKIKEAPHRRKRVRLVYQITTAAGARDSASAAPRPAVGVPDRRRRKMIRELT